MSLLGRTGGESDRALGILGSQGGAPCLLRALGIKIDTNKAQFPYDSELRTYKMTLPTVIIPGYLAGAREYRDLETALNQEGIPATTVPLRKRSWLPTIGGRSVRPILQAIAATVQQVRDTYNSDRVNLIGHSAGGWVARIYLGDRPYDVRSDVSGDEATWNGRRSVAALVTLGTPHISQERWTKRNLDFVRDTYPGAYYQDLRYVCVAGKALYGRRNWSSWFAYNSYQLTCGTGECWGDGITPIAAAHLEGATNLTLDDVWHAPNSPGLWYGSPEPRRAWISYLL